MQRPRTGQKRDGRELSSKWSIYLTYSFFHFQRYYGRLKEYERHTQKSCVLQTYLGNETYWLTFVMTECTKVRPNSSMERAEHRSHFQPRNYYWQTIASERRRFTYSVAPMFPREATHSKIFRQHKLILLGETKENKIRKKEGWKVR